MLKSISRSLPLVLSWNTTGQRKGPLTWGKDFSSMLPNQEDERQQTNIHRFSSSSPCFVFCTVCYCQWMVTG